MATDKHEKVEKIEELARQAEELTPEDAEAVQGGRKAGGDQQEYLIVKMTDVLITG